MTRLVAVILSLVVLSEPALAHAPIKGIGVFYNGVLHSVLVPAHLLLLVGLGLLLGQHAPRLSCYGWFGFLAAFWIGLAAGKAFGMAIPPSALLALALIAGMLVALELALGAAFIVTVTVAAGAGIGLDSTPEASQHREMLLAMSGTAIGGVLIVSYVGGFAAGLNLPWQRIGIRVAGSWTAASAGIVLALALFGRPTAG